VFDEPHTVIDYCQVLFAFLGIPFLTFIIGSNDVPTEKRRRQGALSSSAFPDQFSWPPLYEWDLNSSK